MSDLVRLIYVSSAVGELSDDDLDRVLESSVRHNLEQGVTGLLLYCGGNFMQVLEGERAAVTETYERLCRDPRHKDIILLSVDPIVRRDFGRWSMAFRRVSPADAQSHPGYAPLLANGFDARLLDARPGLALEMLQRFSQDQR